jgi:hypothetical protein
MSKIVAEALNEVYYDRRYEQSEISRFVARCTGKSESTFSRVRSEETEYKHQEAANLSRALSDEMDDDRLAQCYVGATRLLIPRASGTANGRIDDEISDFAVNLGELVEAVRAGDKNRAERACDSLHATLANARAEVDRI